MDDYKNSVAAQLRAEISAAHMSVSEFVRRSGIPRPTLDRYLSGERDMPLGVLYKASEILGVEPPTILKRAHDRAEYSAKRSNDN